MVRTIPSFTSGGYQIIKLHSTSNALSHRLRPTRATRPMIDDSGVHNMAISRLLNR